MGVGSGVLGAQALMSRLSNIRAVIKTVVFVFIQTPFLFFKQRLSSQEFAMIDFHCADFQNAGTDGN